MTDDNRERGTRRVQDLMGPDIKIPFGDPLMDMTVDHLFADIWTRPGLELRERSLITCAALVALGKEFELKIHLQGALNIGISPQSIQEMMIHLAHYSGWPTAVTGWQIAREVIAAREAKGA